jgi:shikimate kinase
MSAAAPRHNIVLIGFMGSGKSSIGRLVAGRLGFQFVDTDAVVWSARDRDPGIFAQHGEAHFRELETAALESMARARPCVISTGGGVIVRERNRALLRELGFVVWLTASEEVIFERVSRNARRPLLQTRTRAKPWRSCSPAAKPLYAETAQFTLDTTTLAGPRLPKQ